eukprot:TRINITY_DN70165_c0_g1_i1.p1 TRINITY_DN70165_c0_g1~~TRINITY_DN70165_c0_g1_i1.p1  ORF type:complete len:244 (-),score=22.42 TRINITY_DN70165_c0_g1_i1:206-937(-)
MSAIAESDLVPAWLLGTWQRSYIRRAKLNDGKYGSLGPPDSSVHVRYVQTPWAFVDVRRASGTTEGAMAFAGIATVVLANSDPPTQSDAPLVRWHACLDMTDPFDDSAKRWAEADRNTPRPTEDEGYFHHLNENVYRETDPLGSLEEQWEKINDGDGLFLAARRNTALLVVAGEYFGFATQASEEMATTFLAGKHPQGWTIEISASDPTLEGSQLLLPGKLSEWHVLRGSTIQLGDLEPRFGS